MSDFTQEAVYESPGICCSVALFKLDAPDQTSSDELARRAARLLQLVEGPSGGPPPYRPGNLQILVALSKRIMGDKVPSGTFDEFIDVGEMKRGDGQADMIVQIAAQNEADRRYGLRLASEVVSRGYWLGATSSVLAGLVQRELHGARILSGLEPFGYRDGAPGAVEGFPPALAGALQLLVSAGAPPNTWIQTLKQRGLLPDHALSNEPRVLEILQRVAKAPAILPSTTSEAQASAVSKQDKSNATLELQAKGPAWLLFQRFEHAFASFTPAAAEAAIGKKPFQSKDEVAPPKGSHLDVAKASTQSILRRGFAYRDDGGREGLVFIALASSSSKFKEALTDHMERDRLIKDGLVRGEAGGVYVVPPTSDWLRTQLALGSEPLDPTRAPVPPIAQQLLRPTSTGVPDLVDYPVAVALPAYVALARARGMFLEPTMELRPDIDSRLAEIEDLLGAGLDLRTLREEIRKTSEAVYQLNGGYLTLGA